MSDIKGRLVEIEKKINHLIEKQKDLLAQNSVLNKKNEELTVKLEEKEEMIRELKDKNNYIKISQSVKQSEGNTDVKIKIDELVREIDKCIGLLNK
jgi:predicted nuclease with TOPRIM domain